eukprot:1496377-Amphidinium_carterae.1
MLSILSLSYLLTPTNRAQAPHTINSGLWEIDFKGSWRIEPESSRSSQSSSPGNLQWQGPARAHPSWMTCTVGHR